MSRCWASRQSTWSRMQFQSNVDGSMSWRSRPCSVKIRSISCSRVLTGWLAYRNSGCRDLCSSRNRLDSFMYTCFSSGGCSFHIFPSILLTSALNTSGWSLAIFLRHVFDHSIKAFIGRRTRLPPAEPAGAGRFARRRVAEVGAGGARVFLHRGFPACALEGAFGRQVEEGSCTSSVSVSGALACPLALEHAAATCRWYSWRSQKLVPKREAKHPSSVHTSKQQPGFSGFDRVGPTKHAVCVARCCARSTAYEPAHEEPKTARVGTHERRMKQTCKGQRGSSVRGGWRGPAMC